METWKEAMTSAERALWLELRLSVLGCEVERTLESMAARPDSMELAAEHRAARERLASVMREATEFLAAEGSL